MSEPTEEQRQAARRLLTIALQYVAYAEMDHAVTEVAAALAEAEARGRAQSRAEVAAKVEGLVADIDSRDVNPPVRYWLNYVANRLRALLADTEGA